MVETDSVKAYGHSASSRRSILKIASAGVLGALSPASSLAQFGRSAPRRRALRVAHLTDIHLQPELHAAEGMEMCLKHAMEQKPDLVVYGGDNIMDALTADRDRVKLQWDLFKSVHRANNHVESHYCFGNHDVFGWGARDRFKSDPLFGKRFTLDVLEYERPYHSFDKGGWHFVILDSIQPKQGNGYVAGLDPEQMDWLKTDLKSVPKGRPVLIVSHIPIAAVCTLLGSNSLKDGNFTISTGQMHADQKALKELFTQHPNVKLCVSGHIHLGDRLEYLGVTYACNGAVSGGWWTGPNQEFKPAYALLDLYDDGTFDRRLVEYGWVAKP